MSRSAAPRQLSLPEELERLEQQITLTLQEIDSNFSKAHRIVTSSILPIVQDYAKHSQNVWDGSKFWKQFFEASANVSLSGYEEAALDGEEEEEQEGEDTTETAQTPSDHSVRNEDESHTLDTPVGDEEEEDFSLDSPTQVTGVQSTPKLPTSTGQKARTHAPPKSSFRSPSPRKYTGQDSRAVPLPSDTPSTPRMRTGLNVQSSPFEPESAYQPSVPRQQTTNNDPVMHRSVLDKNYRIQATPHTQRQRAASTTVTGVPKPTPTNATRQSQPWDDSPQSSPAIAAPQLRSDLFSPVGHAPRTPGVSVLTPAARRTGPPKSTGRELFSAQGRTYTPATQHYTRASNMFSSSDDEDAEGGFDMSPPKTMQFHVPQSRLVQTPAREASRKIVEDLLMTAGADGTDEIEAEGVGLQEASPSMVRMVFEDDDTF